MTSRRTVVTQGRLAVNAILLQAARDRSHGLQVLTFEQLAARLAGGFTRPIDTETLLAAVREALASTALGELDEIKSLPGMLQASAQSLRKAWLAGIDLAARASAHPRIAIASTTPAEYDDHILALRAEAGFDVHFVHGVNILATRDGQGAAALADLLVRGFSQNRVRRLASLSGPKAPFKLLPEGWMRVLPPDVPLSSLEPRGEFFHQRHTDNVNISEFEDAPRL